MELDVNAKSFGVRQNVAELSLAIYQRQCLAKAWQPVDAQKASQIVEECNRLIQVKDNLEAQLKELVEPKQG